MTFISSMKWKVYNSCVSKLQIKYTFFPLHEEKEKSYSRQKMNFLLLYLTIKRKRYKSLIPPAKVRYVLLLLQNGISKLHNSWQICEKSTSLTVSKYHLLNREKEIKCCLILINILKKKTKKKTKTNFRHKSMNKNINMICKQKRSSSMLYFPNVRVYPFISIMSFQVVVCTSPTRHRNVWNRAYSSFRRKRKQFWQSYRPWKFTSSPLVMPPTSKKLEGHIVSGAFPRSSVRSSRFFMYTITLDACFCFEISYMGSLWTNSWQVFFSRQDYAPFLSYCSLKKYGCNLVSKISKKTLEARSEP